MPIGVFTVISKSPSSTYLMFQILVCVLGLVLLAAVAEASSTASAWTVRSRLVTVSAKTDRYSEEKPSPARARARRVVSKSAINFASGGLAGTVSATLTLPLEVIKTQMQSSLGGRNLANVCKTILDKEGAIGFFRGLQPMIIGIMPTRALYFSTYQASKEKFSSFAGIGNGPLNHLMSAFSAGIVSNTIMNPWWMVKTRYQILADTAAGYVR